MAQLSQLAVDQMGFTHYRRVWISQPGPSVVYVLGPFDSTRREVERGASGSRALIVRREQNGYAIYLPAGYRFTTLESFDPQSTGRPSGLIRMKYVIDEHGQRHPFLPDRYKPRRG